MLLTLALASTLLQTPEPRPGPLAPEVVKAIDTHYLSAKEPPWKHLRAALLKAPQATVASLDRQLSSLHDADLRIVTSEQMKTMQAETAGHERGIGLVDFALTVAPDTGEAKVVTALVDSPAFRAGVLPGDVIVAVDGRPTRGLLHEELMFLLRGDLGKVQLTIRRGGKQAQRTVSKTEWDQPDVVFHRIEGTPHLGYLAIRLFTPEAGHKVRQAVASLASNGVNGCIVDLRNNPGGYLDAMAVAGSAFTEDVLGWKIRRDGTREPIQAKERSPTKMRLVVLINEGTASAAEELAAALRDTTGARLVGAKTYGRGQIQTYVKLTDDAGIVIPAATIESPHGFRFNRGNGLVPDLAVPATGAAEENNGDLSYRTGLTLLNQQNQGPPRTEKSFPLPN
ncbi:S41 family peptidase [Terriglobus saanensis]|uniref:C-terminal processing peptidase n=1 Tax=Terriglobus saanensis (strain ATCC BAA-1853 / DSM 23119 / SP1PR4) TaxID=401053 RepID=E8V670_TERSS|nr:S41 family peptidase [Terriglobus saanensis]ADV84961.1 C-terminal processing peptidase [Terriglobus saanensis SP1PR4]